MLQVFVIIFFFILLALLYSLFFTHFVSQFKEKFVSKNGRKPKCPKRIINQAKLAKHNQSLAIGIKFFEKLKIPYWIEYGTLVGYHRGKKIIPYDLDVDFSFLDGDAEKIRRNLHLLPRSVRFYDSSKDHKFNKMGFKNGKENCNCDFYGYGILPNGKLRICLRDSTKGTMDGRDIPFDYIFPLKRCTIEGIETYCPNQTKKYLEHRYGYLGAYSIKKKDGTGHYIPCIP